MLHICITASSGPSLPGPGCVLCPSSGFGFSGVGTGVGTDAAQPPTSISFVRGLLGLLSVLLLVWGSLYGHAIECAAAVIAAILVDAVAAVLRAGKER